MGIYRWQAYITRTSDSERLTVDRGIFEIIANRDAATTDPRSHAAIMVDKIESLMEGRADADVASYAINGRSLTKLSLEDLTIWLYRYKAELLREKHKERAANGEGTGAIIKVRF